MYCFNFDANSQFTYEMEKYFLDVSLTRSRNSIVPTIYRITTKNDLYLNWNSFAPSSWKRGILKILLDRTY